jgi:hypothetical protein
MAFEIPGFSDGTRVAGGDLSSSQYKFVKLNSSGQVVDIAANTDKPYGILQNAPASGGNAEVMLMGISKVQGDGNLAKGDQVGTSADGQAAAYVPGTDTTKYIVGEVVLDNSAAAGIASVAFSCLGAGRGA